MPNSCNLMRSLLGSRLKYSNGDISFGLGSCKVARLEKNKTWLVHLSDTRVDRMTTSYLLIELRLTEGIGVIREKEGSFGAWLFRRNRNFE